MREGGVHPLTPLTLSPYGASRPRVAGEQGRQAQVGRAGELHEEALEADGEAAVGGHAVAEGFEVGGEGFGAQVAGGEGGDVVGIAVEALAAGDELEAAEEQVEGVAVGGRPGSGWV